MANNTKKAIQEAKAKRSKYFNYYVSNFCLLFNNSVEIVNGDDIPKRYLLKVLRNRGAIAYDKQQKIYLPFTEIGIDLYGLPTQYQLIAYNGVTLMRSPDEVVILRANDLQFPMIEYFNQQAGKIVDIDMSIEQNIEAIKTMSIISVRDTAELLSLANYEYARRLGASVVYKEKGVENTVKVENTNAQYLVDKLLEARKEVINETLASIGIAVANTDKRERVQGLEVMASQGYAQDKLNTLVDTFNYDAEIGGLKIRLKANTTLSKNISNTEVSKNV